MNTGPVVNPSQETEQGQRLPGQRTGAGTGIGPVQPLKSPLDLGNAESIIQASGLGQKNTAGGGSHLNPQQFGGGEADEGAEGAGELGELADLAPLALA